MILRDSRCLSPGESRILPNPHLKGLTPPGFFHTSIEGDNAILTGPFDDTSEVLKRVSQIAGSSAVLRLSRRTAHHVVVSWEDIDPWLKTLVEVVMSNVAAETDIVHLKAAAQGSTPATEARLPPLGFIAIECFFTRPSGDPFNQKTWQFPILHELAIGTAESQVVTSQDYDDNFLDRFVAAGQVLADRGCVGLITSCGFLALAQSRCVAMSFANSQNEQKRERSD